MHGAAPHVIDVTEATFDELVIARSHQHPVVVDFWAAWCGPCRMLGPVLERLAAEGGGAWTLAKIDTDANQGLGGRFDIRGIPAVKAFVDGEVVAEFTGVQGEGWLREWLAGLGPSPADTAAKAGWAALRQGDHAAARDQANAALAAAPDHGSALVLAAELALAAGDPDTARAAIGRLGQRQRTAQAHALGPLLARLESGGLDAATAEAQLAQAPDDLERRWAAAHAQAAAGDFAAALAHLMAIVRRDRRFRDDGARKAMLELFAQLGRTELTRRYERKLQMLLF